jgi:hypothetical protein
MWINNSSSLAMKRKAMWCQLTKKRSSVKVNKRRIRTATNWGSSVTRRPSFVRSLYMVIQEKLSLLREVIASVIVGKKVHTNMCLILNDYRDRAISIYRTNSIKFLFVELDEERNLQKESGYTRRIPYSHSVRRCPHKKPWRLTQTNNMRYSYTSCETHWRWRQDFRTFIVNCNEFVICV